MTSPELDAAGFDAGCDGCHEAAARGREACREHYVPVHERPDPRECGTCGGRKLPDEERCQWCRRAGR